MNQMMRMPVTLSEAFLGASDVIVKKRQLNSYEARDYSPSKDVLYFQASAVNEPDLPPFAKQDPTASSVYVIGTLRNKEHYYCNDEVARRLKEEPFKIGTNPIHNRSFIVPFTNAVAFNEKSIDLLSAIYPLEDASYDRPVLAYA